ncbi:flagellin [Thermanaerothrix sp.]|jgi:flagellin|uniref:flagellin n=1 Tax=Thermanaerothrix sp. TaxID=2972675 RepID=UPI002ADE5C6F|nr:flagellin [Thermanaerothrix sp.]
MPTVDYTRIAGNIGALNALNSLQLINNQLAIHQTRLATGKRINEAADDPAGLSLATTFDIRRQGLQTVLNGIGDAKNLLSTAEGGLRKIQDILVKMKNKALEAQSGTIGEKEKEAIAAQLNAYAAEIDAIVEQTQWNGNFLIGQSGSAGGMSATQNFLTSLGTLADPTAVTSEFKFSNNQGFGAYGADENGLGLNTNYTTSNLSTALSDIDAAIEKVKKGISEVGAFSARLSFKEEAITVQYTNTEAAYNRIMNANMAEEQVNASKLLILQQTATAMLAQANTAPQFLLTLFR